MVIVSTKHASIRKSTFICPSYVRYKCLTYFDAAQPQTLLFVSEYRPEFPGIFLLKYFTVGYLYFTDILIDSF